jgi:hypothetical protein
VRGKYINLHALYTEVFRDCIPHACHWRFVHLAAGLAKTRAVIVADQLETPRVDFRHTSERHHPTFKDDHPTIFGFKLFE